MSRYRKPEPTDHLEVEGNNGGSYIRLQKTDKPGVCFLQVGETCVVTISQEVPVAWLAAILTKARDEGFETVLRAYGWEDDFIKTVASQ